MVKKVNNYISSKYFNTYNVKLNLEELTIHYTVRGIYHLKLNRKKKFNVCHTCIQLKNS